MARADWNAYAELGGLRAVIDPADTDGCKNRLIDHIQWNRLRATLRAATRVLDFGCGTGRFARRTANGGRRYVGVDVSTKMIEAAKRANDGADVTFLTFDGRHIPGPPASFDLCFTVTVFQYLVHEADAEAIVSEIHRVLEPGGRLTLIEQASRSGRGSGSVQRAATEQDYVSLLAPYFRIRRVSRIRSCAFCGPTRRLLDAGSKGPLASSLVSRAVAALETHWAASRKDEYFDELDYFDIMIEASAR